MCGGGGFEEIMIEFEHLKFKTLQSQYILQCSVMGNITDGGRLGILKRKKWEK